MPSDLSQANGPTPPSGAAQERGGEFWRRILYMVGYGFVAYFVMLALFVIALVQAIYTLAAGERSLEVASLAGNLTRYLNEIMRFVAWVSDDKPFPARPFPDDTHGAN